MMTLESAEHTFREVAAQIDAGQDVSEAILRAIDTVDAVPARHDGPLPPTEMDSLYNAVMQRGSVILGGIISDGYWRRTLPLAVRQRSR